MDASFEKLNEAGEDVVDVYVDEAIAITQSKIGYFAVMNENEDVLTMIGWSKTAMDACSMIQKPIIYPIVETGLWGDCVRERKPVITNDYENSTRITKKGYPDGHVEVIHHMNVPIMEGSKIVGILGVGNKESGYTEEDIEKITGICKHWLAVCENGGATENFRILKGDNYMNCIKKTDLPLLPT